MTTIKTIITKRTQPTTIKAIAKVDKPPFSGTLSPPPGSSVIGEGEGAGSGLTLFSIFIENKVVQKTFFLFANLNNN